MKANTACAFLLIGMALLLQGRAPPRARWRTLTARGCAVIVGLVGALTLSEYLGGWDLGIDQLLFAEAPGAVATSSLGRMAPNTAVCFVLIGVALLSLDARPRGGFVLPQNLALLVCGLGLTALIGYLYGVPSLHSFARHFTAMAAHTAFTFVVVTVGVVCARPTWGWMRLVTADGIGGFLARQLPRHPDLRRDPGGGLRGAAAGACPRPGEKRPVAAQCGP